MKKTIIISMLAGLTLMAASCGKTSDSSDNKNAPRFSCFTGCNER
ncbi:MAG TPA: hypothetical protein P5191_02705 [Ruminococcus sp.]|nr:hypothetical protein [Ruminococcus sp.]